MHTHTGEVDALADIRLGTAKHGDVILGRVIPMIELNKPRISGCCLSSMFFLACNNTPLTEV